MRIFFQGLTFSNDEVAGTLDVDLGLPSKKKVRVLFRATVGLFYHKMTNVPDISGVKLTSLDAVYMPDTVWVEYVPTDIDNHKIMRAISSNTKDMLRYKARELIQKKEKF